MLTPLECVNESRHDPAARLVAGLSLPGARSEMGLINPDRLPGIREQRAACVSERDRRHERRTMTLALRGSVLAESDSVQTLVPNDQRFGTARRFLLEKQRAIWVGTPARPSAELPPDGERRKQPKCFRFRTRHY